MSSRILTAAANPRNAAVGPHRFGDAHVAGVEELVVVLPVAQGQHGVDGHDEGGDAGEDGGGDHGVHLDTWRLLRPQLVSRATMQITKCKARKKNTENTQRAG